METDWEQICRPEAANNQESLQMLLNLSTSLAIIRSGHCEVIVIYSLLDVTVRERSILLVV